MVLIGYWPLNETSGSTAYDRSGQNNHGSLNGDLTQGANGILGTKAYNFDGTDDYISLPSLKSFKTFSVSVWVQCDTPNDGNQHIIFQARDSNDFTLMKGSSDQWNGWYYDGSNSQRLTVAQNVDSAWHHLVFEWSGSTVRLFVDGVAEASLSASASMASAGVNTRIGSYGNDTSYWDGIIADVRVYDHALTQQEVQYLYQTAQKGRMLTDVRRG